MSDETGETAEKGRSPRRQAAWIGVFVLTLVVGVWVLDAKTTPRLVHGPMVQRVLPDGFTVTWEARPHRSGELILEYGEREKTRVSAERNGVDYQATVRGLPGSSAIRYRIRHRSVVGWPHVIAGATTRTAKRAGEPFRFLVFGDSGSGGNAQKALAQRMESYDADLILHVGDLVYQAGHPSNYALNFYEPNAGLIRSVPFYPVLGNHDVITENGRPMLDRFVLPANGPPKLEPERNFSMQYADALFVGLDSNLDEDILRQQVAPWLEALLASSKACWKFVYFHHPPYTGSKHAPDRKMQETVVPVLERGHVDVVFVGHNHLYERTARIYQGAVSQERGIYYIVTGAGGMSKYPERADAPAYIVTYNDRVFNFTVVDVADHQLRLRQISERGNTIDEWTLHKAGGKRRFASF